MDIRQLTDGRWQIIRDDGVYFSLTYEQWQEAMAKIEEARSGHR